jgi:hypothetical protein
LAKWQPRVTPETEAALRALGPYSVPQGGYLLWEPAPGFEWPWGPSNLGFGVHTRTANDADYRRLLDAWRQVCARREGVLGMIRSAVLNSWASSAAPDSVPDASDEVVFGQTRGCHFALSTGGPGQVGIEAYVALAWDEEHGVQIDLVTPENRLSWSFM